jgi:hypothetical protein
MTVSIDPFKAKLINAPPDWWKAFERAAQAEGTSVSAWLSEAGRAKLPSFVRKTLSGRRPKTKAS